MNRLFLYFQIWILLQPRKCKEETWCRRTKTINELIPLQWISHVFLHGWEFFIPRGSRSINTLQMMLTSLARIDFFTWTNLALNDDLDFLLGVASRINIQRHALVTQTDWQTKRKEESESSNTPGLLAPLDPSLKLFLSFFLLPISLSVPRQGSSIVSFPHVPTKNKNVHFQLAGNIWNTTQVCRVYPAPAGHAVGSKDKSLWFPITSNGFQCGI